MKTKHVKTMERYITIKTVIEYFTNIGDIFMSKKKKTEEYENCRTVVVKETGAIKHDQGKPDLHKIDEWLDEKFLLEVASVLQFGARKYEANQWKLGMDEGRLASACKRHLNKYMSGMSDDEESGLHHLAHAACSLMFLYYYDQMKSQPTFRCSKCGNTYLKHEFHPRPDRPRGVSSQCKYCVAKTRRTIRHCKVLEEIVVFELQDGSSTIVDLPVGLKIIHDGLTITKDASGYALIGTGKDRIKLHQFVFGATGEGRSIDHINRDKLDNRSENLREATASQQVVNRAWKTFSVGVTYNKSDKRWNSYSYQNGKRVHIGNFLNKGDAEMHASLYKLNYEKEGML